MSKKKIDKKIEELNVEKQKYIDKCLYADDELTQEYLHQIDLIDRDIEQYQEMKEEDKKLNKKLLIVSGLIVTGVVIDTVIRKLK